jgi:hypothetical protein
MAGDDLTKAEWDALSDAQWRDILKSEWEKPYVSLSAAVHWIAANGEPRECDFDELNEGAKALVGALHEGKLPLLGIPRGKSFHEPVPSTALLRIPAFFDDGGETQSFGTDPYMEWNRLLEDDRCDVITDRCDTPHWRDLSVSMVDMQSLWPAEGAEAERSPAPDEAVRSGTLRTEDYRTGRRGRFTAEPYILPKFLERCESGEVLAKIGDEARYLRA